MKIELAIEWETHRAIEMRGPQPYFLFLKTKNEKQFLIIKHFFFILKNRKLFLKIITKQTFRL